MLSEMTAADRRATYWDKTVNYLPVVTSENQGSILSTPDAYDFSAGKGEGIYPTWKNQVTVESIEKMIEYNPTQAIELISPTPLLVIAAESDSLIPIDLVKDTVAQAGEPKKLVVLPVDISTFLKKSPGMNRRQLPRQTGL